MPFADVETAFKSDYDPITPGPQTDIHLSGKGYKKIASASSELIDNLGLLDT